MTPLPRSEYIRIPLKFLSAQILAEHNLHPFIFTNSILFEVTKSMYGGKDRTRQPQSSIINKHPIITIIDY
jgi:hypothetical protein